MDTSESQSIRNTLGGLSSLTHFGALFLVLLYGSGFFIVSLHYASYGIVQFDLLRSRVISAGTLFFVLFAISSFETSKAYGILGFASGAEARLPKSLLAGGSAPAKLVMGFEGVFQALILSFFLGFILLDLPFREVELGLMVGLTGFDVAALLVARRRFERVPWRCAILVISCLFLTFLVLGDISWQRLLFFLWILLSGDLAVRGADYLKNPEKLREISYSPHISWCLTVLLIFAYFVYPNIKPAFGGGVPSDIELHFAQKWPGIDRLNTHAWLIDENNNGFYVLWHAQDKRAIFVPRAEITAVEYGHTN
jgi:hypothetical protein